MRERRHAAQPKGIKTFGSTFKNPPGHSAGSCCWRAGAGGAARRGRALLAQARQLRREHRRRETAEIIALMAAARERVRERFGIELEPEVQLLGDVAFPGRGLRARARSSSRDGAVRRSSVARAPGVSCCPVASRSRRLDAAAHELACFAVDRGHHRRRSRRTRCRSVSRLQLIAAARAQTTTDFSVGALRAAVAPYTLITGVRAQTHFPHGLRIEVRRAPADRAPRGRAAAISRCRRRPRDHRPGRRRLAGGRALRPACPPAAAQRPLRAARAARARATRRRRCATASAAVTARRRRADDLPAPRPATDLRQRRAAAREVGRRRGGARLPRARAAPPTSTCASRRVPPRRSATRRRSTRAPPRRRAPTTPSGAATVATRAAIRPDRTLKLNFRLIAAGGPISGRGRGFGDLQRKLR